MTNTRKKSPGRSTRKVSPGRKPKTFVFPYEALSPIVHINDKGAPNVSPGPSSGPVNIDQIMESLARVSTKEDIGVIREAIERIRPAVGEDNQRIREMEAMLERLTGLEEDIERKIDAINARIASLSRETASGGYSREVIEELQRMESEILSSLEGVRGLVSSEVIRKSEATSEKITQFMITLDELKASMIQEIRNVRNVCADGKEIERLLENSDQLGDTMKRIENIIKDNVQSLSGARGEETLKVRDQMENLTTSSSKEEIQQVIRAENQALETLLGEMKKETREQIDRILRSFEGEDSKEELERELERERQRANDLETEKAADERTLSQERKKVRDLEAMNRRVNDDLEAGKRENENRLLALQRELLANRDKVTDLEQKLEASRFASVSTEQLESLRQELETAKAEHKAQLEKVGQEKVVETNRLQRELTGKQKELTGLSEQLETALRDLKNISVTEEAYNEKLREYTAQKKTLEALERQIAGILRANGREVVGDLTYGSYNTEVINSYINTLKENLAAAASAPPKQAPVPTAPVPRYVVIRKSKDLIDLVNLDRPEADFSGITRSILGDLYGYSTQVVNTYESVRRAMNDNEFVFYVRGTLLKTLAPTNVEQYFSDYDLTPVIIEDESEKRQVGKFVLVDVFSPFVNPNVTTNANIVVASGIMKVFSYGDAIDLAMSPFEGYFSKQQLANNLKRILRSAGREIPGERRILYDAQDLFTVLMFLLDDAKLYTTEMLKRPSGTPLKMDAVYSLEVRLILIDAFVKAFLEVKNSLEVLKNYYGSRESSTETPAAPKNVLSYVRIRADGNVIDPRFSVLVNSQIPGEARTKIQISHQPFVIPSLAVNDVDTPYYQHDVYGPFTRVFLPSETNADMAGDIQEMVNALNENKDVCAVSLGPSGSGKTSTLLYFRGTAGTLPSKGVIPLMMSRLDQRFSQVKVLGYEMAANYQSTGRDDYWKRYDVFEKPVTFERAETDWMSKGRTEIETFAYSDAANVCEREDPFKELKRVRTQFSDVSIGDFLSKLIDIRLNCGTPLNPVSSRTHLFLFLRFVSSKGLESPTLIVADLAGRERSFDCESESILEMFSMNRYYPSLNQMINDPLGTAPSNPMFDPKRTGKFPKEGIHSSLVNKKPVTDIITPLTSYPLLELFSMLHLDAFFPFVAASSSTKGEGFVLDKTGKDVSDVFYKFLARVMNMFLEENYHQSVVKRIISIDSQPLELRNLLQKLDNQKLLDGILAIVKYFARGPVYPGANVLAGRSQFDRLGEIKFDKQSILNILELMPTYLNAVLLIKYLSGLLRDKPVGVCRYRNVEGEFINRSLDEISNMIMIASATDKNGPRIHPECLPISCSFAGMDCLLPKNVPKTHRESALSQILKEGTGRSSFKIEDTVFCAFVIINLTRKPVTDTAPTPVFDSTEPMLAEVLQAFDRIKKNAGMYSTLADETDDRNTQRRLVSELTQMITGFMEAYRREVELVQTHRGRLDYRGMDPRRMITDAYLREAFASSVSNWMAMRNSQEAILNILGTRELLTAPTQVIMEIDGLLGEVRDFSNMVRIKNQNSSLGVLSFADDLVKRGLQPLTCSTFDSKERVLQSQVGWVNPQYIS